MELPTYPENFVRMMQEIRSCRAFIFPSLEGTEREGERK